MQRAIEKIHILTRYRHLHLADSRGEERRGDEGALLVAELQEFQAVLVFGHVGGPGAGGAGNLGIPVGRVRARDFRILCSRLNLGVGQGRIRIARLSATTLAASGTSLIGNGELIHFPGAGLCRGADILEGHLDLLSLVAGQIYLTTINKIPGQRGRIGDAGQFCPGAVLLTHPNGRFLLGFVNRYKLIDSMTESQHRMLGRREVDDRRNQPAFGIICLLIIAGCFHSISVVITPDIRQALGKRLVVDHKIALPGSFEILHVGEVFRSTLSATGSGDRHGDGLGGGREGALDRGDGHGDRGRAGGLGRDFAIGIHRRNAGVARAEGRRGAGVGGRRERGALTDREVQGGRADGQRRRDRLDRRLAAVLAVVGDDLLQAPVAGAGGARQLHGFGRTGPGLGGLIITADIDAAERSVIREVGLGHAVVRVLARVEGIFDLDDRLGGRHRDPAVAINAHAGAGRVVLAVIAAGAEEHGHTALRERLLVLRAVLQAQIGEDDGV